MKALFNTLLVALTVAFTSFTAAQAENHKPIGQPKKVAAFQSGMYTTQEGKLQVAVNKETGSAVMVRLVNQAGKEVFAQSIGKRQQAVRLRLDVSNLPDGIYQVEITNGVETTTQELKLDTRKPTAVQRLVAVN
ncbi:putative secreted protein (Por secretion system target) [Larkinella arboricola]|uniref:Putative secreted protein (Por secretion system target) n=1 Tax=Larkinella arboricola TaxID=643671 RepID=A0A327WTG1_LARAB|nr:T9SS type A sorting domain-containing protein [Larkinella arboricola]RAJ94532.1 putative secreted protein (Por secretion system target) [Larkinella arboricola]